MVVFGLGAVVAALSQAVAEFLENNEFGLAYDLLKECNSHDERDSRFADNMEKAAEMMAKGWKSFDV